MYESQILLTIERYAKRYKKVMNLHLGLPQI